MPMLPLSIQLRRKAAAIPGPSSPSDPYDPDAPITPQENIIAISDEWKPVLMEGLGLFGIGALAYMLYLEAQGKPTLLSRLATSPTGAEMVRGAWDFLGSAAKAGAANPALGFITAWAAVQLMQKAKIVTEKAGAWATAGVFGLEGVTVAADAIGALEGIFGGGKSHEGPTTYAITDARSISYGIPAQFQLPVMEQPKQIPVNPIILKAIQAMTKKEKKALME